MNIPEKSKTVAALLTAILSSTLSTVVLAYDNWYPTSITPPAGHQYPCALVALPVSLDGIPAGDREFINHAYSMILKCLQAKMLMIDALYKNNENYSSAFNQYLKETTAAKQKIAAEKAPSGLDEFKNDVIKAIDLQISFFRTGTQLREQHKDMQTVLAVPEGRAASSSLFAAWNKMSSRYPSWSPSVKDSIYHHLCALDLF